MNKRAGILMPISSLPNKYGIGTIGESAYKFVDFLYDSKIKIWQILPLLPTGFGNSPYQSSDSNALNYYFIDFDSLRNDGLLKKSDYENIQWSFNDSEVDYYQQFLYKLKVLKKAFNNFNKKTKSWKEFIKEGKYLDFAVFMSLKEDNGYKCHKEWAQYSKYDKTLIENYITINKERIEFWQFTQYIFLKQWNKLKKYANKKGIEIMGDMPIYVAEDSVEMWKYKEDLFLLDENGNPSLVAGVPPDAFSDEGQLWGNPIYNWEKMKENGYSWWLLRIDNALTLFDIVRIDHFRGFDRFYAIKTGSETAKEGKWLDGPKASLFANRKNCKIVAEDLGIIDDGVIKLMNDTGYPGMKVLRFAFDGNKYNSHKPSNFIENSVAYTGTHDNEPFMAYLESASLYEVETLKSDLKLECLLAKVKCNVSNNKNILKTVLRLIFNSKANTVIVPYQDILMLGENARINSPSLVSKGNWSYRFVKKDFNKKTANYLKKLVENSNR